MPTPPTAARAATCQTWAWPVKTSAAEVPLRECPERVGRHDHLMTGQPVGDHAAEKQEGDQGNQLSRRDVSEIAGRASDPENRERDRHEGDRRPGGGDDVACGQQPGVTAAQRT